MLLQNVPIRVAPSQTYSLVLPAALSNVSVSFSCGTVIQTQSLLTIDTYVDLGQNCPISIGPKFNATLSIVGEHGIYNVHPAVFRPKQLTVGSPMPSMQLYQREYVLYPGPLRSHSVYVSSKTLPPGITLNPHSGLISGTPLIPFNKTTFAFRLEDIFSHAGAVIAEVTLEAEPPKPVSSSSLSTRSVVGLVVGIAGGLLLIILTLFVLLVRNNRQKNGPYNFEPMLVTIGETIRLHDAELRSPKEIRRDKVKLLEMLGEGNFAQVRKALYVESSGHTSYIVAVKTLHDAAGSSDRQDMLHEAVLMAQFDHPCVVSLVGVVTVGEPLLVVIEYCEHGALSSYLKQANLKRREKYALSTDCAEGLAYLGKRGFVHRDIAARNVLVSSDRRAKISDFGLSREVHGASAYYRMKSKGELPVRWTAPEALNNGVFTQQSDCWSFGVLLWEIWSNGKYPYSEVDSNQVVWMYVTDGYRLKRPKHCPEAVYELMQKCWQLEPSARPEMAECAAALHALMQPKFRNGKFYKMQSVGVLSSSDESSRSENASRASSEDATAAAAADSDTMHAASTNPYHDGGNETPNSHDDQRRYQSAATNRSRLPPKPHSRNDSLTLPPLLHPQDRTAADILANVVIIPNRSPRRLQTAQRGSGMYNSVALVAVDDASGAGVQGGEARVLALPGQQFGTVAATSVTAASADRASCSASPQRSSQWTSEPPTSTCVKSKLRSEGKKGDDGATVAAAGVSQPVRTVIDAHESEV